MTKLYAAPLEGVTTPIWRNAHRCLFGGADKYYTPFLSPNATLKFQTKEVRELTTGETDLVPQLLTNSAEYFIWGAKEVQKYGFTEVNFNLGCPSGTVVAKHKGSGLLDDPENLARMLDEIFTALPDMQISIKTRIGRHSAEEWEKILAVYEQFPIHELTIHPRIQKEFYTGLAHRDVFTAAMASTSLPLVYNGDVNSPDDDALSYGCPVMLGRGLIRRPSLLREVQGGAKASREELTEMHERVYHEYTELLSGALNAIYRMREFWNYLSCSFEETEDSIKRIRKAKTAAEYEAAAQNILRNCPMK